MEICGKLWKIKKNRCNGSLGTAAFCLGKVPESLKEMSTHDKNSNIVALVRKKTNYYE